MLFDTPYLEFACFDIDLGYDLMGFHLSKPNLRADLEADLKLICDGTASKRDVLSKHTTIYKEVFEASIRQAGK